MGDYNITIKANLDKNGKTDIQSQLDALKDLFVKVRAKLDDNTQASLQKGLNSLSSQLSVDIIGRLSSESVNEISKQIENIANAITITLNPTINAGGLTTTGAQAGEVISQAMQDAIDKVSSKQIEVGFSVDQNASQKFQKEVEAAIASIQGGGATGISYKLNTYTEFDEGTQQYVEHLKSAIFQYTTATGEAIRKTVEFDEAQNVWVEGSASYSKSLVAASDKAANFAEKQKEAAASYKNTLSTIESSINDKNATRSIAGTDFDANGITEQIKRVDDAIDALGNSTQETFTDAKILVENEITALKNLVKQIQNAEYVATSLRTKDFATVKKNEQNNIIPDYTKITASTLTDSEGNSFSARAKKLKEDLDNALNPASLTQFLNEWENLTSEFRATEKVARQTANAIGIAAKASEEMSKLRIFETANPEVKQFSTEINGTTLSVQSLLTALEGVSSQADLTALVKQIKAYEAAAIQAGKATKDTASSYDTLLKKANEAISTNKYSGQTAKIKDSFSKIDKKLIDPSLQADFNRLIELSGNLNASMSDDEKVNAYKELEILIPKIRNQLTEISSKQAKLSSAQNILGAFDNGSYDLQIKAAQAELQKYGFTEEEVKEKTAVLIEKLNAMVEAARNYASGSGDYAPVIKAQQEYQEELRKSQLECKKLNMEGSKIDPSKNLKLSNQITEWAQKNTRAIKKFGTQIEWMKEQLKGADEITFNNVLAQFEKLKIDARDAGVLGKSLSDRIKEAAENFTQWLSVTSIIMQGAQAVRKMYSEVEELDSSLLELSKVSDETAEGLADITKEAYKLGAVVGRTGTEVINAITAFKRAGFEIEQSIDLAETALKMTNVAEGITESSDAAQYLISIMKGYQDTSSEFAKKITDSINQVSNTRAVDFDNLADGAQRLSAIANQAGVSFDEMLGVLTGGYEVLGNMEKTASGLVTIFTRLQSIQLADEEEVESIAKLQETFSSNTNGVVNIVDQTTGQLRSAYDILSDLSTVWDTLDKNTQEGLAFKAGGTRQKSVFLSIMSNWDSVEKSIQSSIDSMNSADEENEKFLNSVQGRIKAFQSAYEELSQSVLSSDLVKFVVDGGTKIIKILDSIVEKTGALAPLVGVGLNKWLG